MASDPPGRAGGEVNRRHRELQGAESGDNRGEHRESEHGSEHDGFHSMSPAVCIEHAACRLVRGGSAAETSGNVDE